MIHRLPYRFVALLAFFSVSAAAQSGTGLTGKYYDASNFTTLVTTRTDPAIDFDFDFTTFNHTEQIRCHRFQIATLRCIVKQRRTCQK
jgi:hypothetical protein